MLNFKVSYHNVDLDIIQKKLNNNKKMVNEINSIAIFRDFLKSEDEDMDAIETQKLINLFEKISTGEVEDIGQEIKSFVEEI